jgi:hypothetical protein
MNSDAVAHELEMLKRALEKTKKLLPGSDAGELQQAGKIMCDALGAVLGDEHGDGQRRPGLLGILRQELTDPEIHKIARPLRQPDIVELRQLLDAPVISEVLHRLGYDPPPAIVLLVDNTGQPLKEIASTTHQEVPGHLFDQAQQAIDKLRLEICHLSKTGENPTRLHRLLVGGRAVIGQILLATVVALGSAAITQLLGHHMAELIEALLHQLGDLWAVVSISSVAAIPVEATRWLDQAGELPPTRDAGQKAAPERDTAKAQDPRDAVPPLPPLPKAELDADTGSSSREAVLPPPFSTVVGPVDPGIPAGTTDAGIDPAESASPYPPREGEEGQQAR